MGKMIGIDLGTTNSVVAVMEGDEAKVIVNEEGARTTPSVVAWDDSGEVLVGQIAKRQALTNAEATVFSAKRFIGKRYDESGADRARVPFEVFARDNGDAAFRVRGKALAPPEVSAHVLRKLKKAAEDYLGAPVSEAVITVPAYFNDAQRQATKDAGKIAGLEVKRIINEPTAAALAYGLEKKTEEVIAVYDFGGGTFDISILEVADGVVQVLSTGGDTALGGDDIDHELVEYLIAEFKKEQGIDVGQDKLVLQRLRDAAESAKIELSSKLETTVNLPFLTADANGPKHMNIKVGRASFEQKIAALVQRTLKACKQALADAGKSVEQIDEVVLVGGSTRIPLVQKEVSGFFGKQPHRGVNPDEVVAIGAATQAGVLSGDVKDVLLLDVTPLSLGVETLGGVMTALIPRNTTIPTRREEVFSTADDNQPSVDIHVLQGERASAGDNRTLGRFRLEGIDTAPRGTPQIKVTFDIDANGILAVTARDEATGKDKRITISAGSGLSEAEVQRMVDDAKQHESEDARRRSEVEQRNAADQLCYAAEQALNQLGDAAPQQAEIREHIKELRSAIERHDSAAIESGHRALEQLLQQLGQQAQASASAAAEPSANEDVIDAEFEEGDDTSRAA
ncbi:MAG: molecular chaperone DnaK [Myxococcales bacterium]|nr:molecular chaperone DnaK [Myxococcales bacterium]